jgi:hypothetical protein
MEEKTQEVARENGRVYLITTIKQEITETDIETTEKNLERLETNILADREKLRELKELFE